MEHNKGYMIEQKIKTDYNGESHPLGCVDFQTSSILYEVKSCNLFRLVKNSNSKKPRKHGPPYPDVWSHGLGRFCIKIHNHEELKIQAEEEKKEARYVFALIVGGQVVTTEKTWEEVDKIIKKDKKEFQLQIKHVFI